MQDGGSKIFESAFDHFVRSELNQSNEIGSSHTERVEDRSEAHDLYSFRAQSFHNDGIPL